MALNASIGSSWILTLGWRSLYQALSDFILRASAQRASHKLLGSSSTSYSGSIGKESGSGDCGKHFNRVCPHLSIRMDRHESRMDGPMLRRKCRHGGSEEPPYHIRAEAAAVYAFQKLAPENLSFRDGFTLCDAGGGTVDLTSYRITSLKPRLEVDEISEGRSASCRSSIVDHWCEVYTQDCFEAVLIDMLIVLPS